MTRVSTLALLWSVVVLVACSSPTPRQSPPQVDTAAASIAPGPPPAVVIPDFSKLSPPVRKQMDAAASAFREHVARQDAPATERAAAYGTFGELLMASDFRTTAAACFANAEALAPRELRWPYYLGHLYRREGRTLEAAAAFERAVRADPTFMPAFVWLGNSYLDEGNADAARVQFSKALV